MSEHAQIAPIEADETVAVPVSELERLRAIAGLVAEMVIPRSESGAIDTELETAQDQRNALHWKPKQVRRMAGSSLWDDHPDGWTRRDLVMFFRGDLRGRAIAAGNIGQHYRRFLTAFADPVRAWRRWRIGVLSMYEHAPCTRCQGLDGLVLDRERIGLACPVCGTFVSYEEVRRMAGFDESEDEEGGQP